MMQTKKVTNKNRLTCKELAGV